MSIKSLPLVLSIVVVVVVGTAGATTTTTTTNPDDALGELMCQDPKLVPELDELGKSCFALKLYNQTDIDQESPIYWAKLAQFCACQLSYMTKKWNRSFYMDRATQSLSVIVKQLLFRQSYDFISIDEKSIDQVLPISDEHRQLVSNAPGFLWSDTDIIVNKISIYTSVRDYFEKQLLPNSPYLLKGRLRKEMANNETWRMIRNVCYKIYLDPYDLYQNLENLARLNGLVLLQLVRKNAYVDHIYTASKACKILLSLNYTAYKVRPENLRMIPVASLVAAKNGSTSLNETSNLSDEYENEVEMGSTLDLQLREASSQLLLCKNNSATTPLLKLSELEEECPMMVHEDESLPRTWLAKHATILDRSDMALSCGCQLLGHNKTWSDILQDPNVSVMSSALTSYMNRRQLPMFKHTPTWSLHAWFQSIMTYFIQNKKHSLKEIVKAQVGDQDPLTPIGHDQMESALEVLRRGCNLIVFNYRKGNKFSNELRLIRYLDRLQLISQDPDFVFHLSLLEPNLFKLHALSKMCIPVLR